jgi:hypothetical protein
MKTALMWTINDFLCMEWFLVGARMKNNKAFTLEMVVKKFFIAIDDFCQRITSIERT